jgi:ABC-type transport system involved in multi-copper enzyme maturation permease subunit
MVIMTASLFVVHAGYEGSTEIGILVASAGIFLEIVLLICFASLFSTFTTPVLSALFTLSVFLIGHVSKDLLTFGGRSASTAVRAAAGLFYYVLPDFTHFNWKNEVVYGEVRSFSVLLLPAVYLTLYGGAVLLLASLIFARKDFK